MIKVTRLNGKAFYINVELIQFIEATPDTVISFTNEVKVVVRESVDEVIERIIQYRRRVLDGLQTSYTGA